MLLLFFFIFFFIHFYPTPYTPARGFCRNSLARRRPSGQPFARNWANRKSRCRRHRRRRRRNDVPRTNIYTEIMAPDSRVYNKSTQYCPFITM